MTTTSVLPVIKPMLASPTTKTGSRRAITLDSLLKQPDRWTYDMKLDGLRCILYWDGHRVRLVNRTGLDITHRFPEVFRLGDALAGNAPVVLDGELVCESGRFNDVATRGKQDKPAAVASAVLQFPARFIAFDILWWDDLDQRPRRYSDRRTLLEVTLQHIADPRLVPSIATKEGAAMWAGVQAQGLEGMIAKDNTAPYTDGKRSPAWLKYKCVRRLTCIVVSYEPGTGSRAHFGAMNLCLLDGGKMVPVGDVGTGFNQQEIAWLKTELDAGRPVLAEIEALNVGSNGRLRFPVYVGHRDDIALTDCTVDQLDHFPRC